jgi:hypothetical protein
MWSAQNDTKSGVSTGSCVADAHARAIQDHPDFM